MKYAALLLFGLLLLAAPVKAQTSEEVLTRLDQFQLYTGCKDV